MWGAVSRNVHFVRKNGCRPVSGPAARRRGVQVTTLAAPITVAAFLVLTLGAPAQLASASLARLVTAADDAPATGSASGGAGLPVLDVVVLVDESGSETPAKVADEKQTVGTIVQSMLNPASRVTVVGFGGVNHLAPNQSAVSVVCQPTIASGTQNLGYLTTCVNKVRPRTEQQGDDTDYAAALEQAMSYLGPGSTATPASPPGAIKIILMMTDGAVDVRRDTQQYGKDWQEGEQVAIGQQLTLARQDGAQVWPLGFGTDIGTGITEPQALRYLNQIAAGGAPAVCGTQRAPVQPHATWVNDPSDAINALSQLESDAACGIGIDKTPKIPIAGGQAKTLSVTIPAFASDAVISVDRVNPGIAVGFSLPGGRAWTDTSAISGQDNSSAVEVLHVGNVTNSDVGAWKIRLTARPGLASQLVQATAFFQGAVRAVITASPPSAKLGQPVSVTLSVLGPRGPITPADLPGLHVGVTASGQGLAGPTQVPMKAQPATSNYAGTFRAPRQPGTITLTGTAFGYGLYATQVPANVSVGAAIPAFTASVAFPVVTSVQVGGSITGHIIFSNRTGAARRVRLTLAASGAVASITSPSGPVTAPSPNPPSVPFTVRIGQHSPPRPAVLLVKVVDAATGQVYNAQTLNITVTTPPGFFARYKWIIGGVIAAIILIILAILWRRRVIRQRKDVRGLIATLRRDGQQLGKEFPAPGRWSDVFRFIIRDEAEPTARLDFPQSGFSEYQVRRARRGEVKLTTPAGGKPYDVVVDGPGKVMEHNGLELALRNDPRRQRGGRGGPAGGRVPRGRPASQSRPSGSNGPSTVPSAQKKDEWL